jgi:hypothetical protein
MVHQTGRKIRVKSCIRSRHVFVLLQQTLAFHLPHDSHANSETNGLDR